MMVPATAISTPPAFTVYETHAYGAVRIVVVYRRTVAAIREIGSSVEELFGPFARIAEQLVYDAIDDVVPKLFGHGAPGPSPEERDVEVVDRTAADPLQRWRARARRLA